MFYSWDQFFFTFFKSFQTFHLAMGVGKGKQWGNFSKSQQKNILCFEWEKFSLLLATPTNIFEKSPINFSLGKILLTSMVLRLCLRLHVLCLLCFYQAYCTPVVRYWHVTGGGRIRFQLWRSTGGSIATALFLYSEKPLTCKNWSDILQRSAVSLDTCF